MNRIFALGFAMLLAGFIVGCVIACMWLFDDNDELFGAMGICSLITTFGGALMFITIFAGVIIGVLKWSS